MTKRKTKQDIYEELREAILLGRIPPGAHLTEERLAEQFAVSRTPIREVLMRLEADRLVEQGRFRGAAVRRFAASELRGIYDLRALLESYAARQAATHLDADGIAALEQLTDQMAAGGGLLGRGSSSQERELRRIVEVNQEFHHIIAVASQNPYLLTTLQHIIQLPLIYRSMQYYGPDGLDTSLRQHRELTKALAQRDPDWAEAVMRAHIYHGRDALFQHLDDLQSEVEPH